MQPLTLYQIPFSHFCDKVRWGLDFYSIPYKTVNYTGRQTPGFKKAPKELQKLTPLIEDPNNNSYFISDSTPILLYLTENYGNNNKTLFPLNNKDDIIQYCLKLDSQLGLYARRLGYLHVISEQPAILSVYIDHNYNKKSCNDWKSYIFGLFGSCIVIGRLGIHQIKEENIFEKTIFILEEIKNDIHEKQYLFNNQFTAADLTLTSLMYPLRFVPSLCIKYKIIFDYCDRIREFYDPNKNYKSNMQYLFENRPKKYQSFIRNIILFVFNIIFCPLYFVFNDNNNNNNKKPLYQYLSINIQKKANNDVRVLRWSSMIRNFIFFIKTFWILFFIVPKQMEFVTNEGNKLLYEN